jgi:hypothetical protein
VGVSTKTSNWLLYNTEFICHSSFIQGWAELSDRWKNASRPVQNLLIYLNTEKAWTEHKISVHVGFALGKVALGQVFV